MPRKKVNHPPVIYKITSPTNKVYIGQSRDYILRMKTYQGLQCKFQPKLYRSLLKHGFAAHKVEVVEQFGYEISQIELNEKERYYISLYSKNGCSLLNLSYSSINGGLHSEETKAKISNRQLGRIPWNKGKKQSPEHLEINKRSHIGVVSRKKGYKLSDEVKNRISKTLTGAKLSAEHCKNISTGSMGKKMSESAKKKMSISAMGNKKGLGTKRTNEQRKRMSDSHKGAKLPMLLGENNPSKRPEVREKIRLSKIEFWKRRKESICQ